MESTLIRKHLVRFAGLLASAVFLFAAIRRFAMYGVIAPETEALNTLILLMGSIYAVMFAFVIFVIWGQFTDVENLSARECSALRDLLRFSEYVQPDPQRAIRRAVAEYSRMVRTAEWDALGNGRKDQETERAFAKLLKAVVQVSPTSAAEEVVFRRLVDIGREAGQFRDERIEKSLVRIPPTLMHLVRAMAMAILLLVLVYPFHNVFVGTASFVLVGCILFFADVVMMDTDNPFSGLCNVEARPFADLAA